MQLEIHVSSTLKEDGWHRVMVQMREVDDDQHWSEIGEENALVQAGLDVNEAVLEMIERLLP